MNERIIDYYNGNIEKKVKLISDKQGLLPHEALGISEDGYSQLSLSVKYARLLSYCKLNGLCAQKRKPVNTEKEIELYKYFISNAPENVVMKICGTIYQQVEQTRKRKGLEAKIRQKKKEIKELEKMIRKL